MGMQKVISWKEWKLNGASWNMTSKTVSKYRKRSRRDQEEYRTMSNTDWAVPIYDIRDLKHRRQTRGRRRELSEVWVENVVHGRKTEMLSSHVNITEDLSCKQTENLYPQFYFHHAFISRATRAFTSKPWFWCNRWWRLTAALWRVCAKKSEFFLWIQQAVTWRHERCWMFGRVQV